MWIWLSEGVFLVKIPFALFLDVRNNSRISFVRIHAQKWGCEELGKDLLKNEGFMSDTLIVNKLHKSFGKLVAVHDLSFEVREAEILGMMGPNGAGKTTVFNLLTGILKPDAGEIIFKGEDVTHESPSKKCRQGMGRTY